MKIGMNFSHIYIQTWTFSFFSDHMFKIIKNIGLDTCHTVPYALKYRVLDSCSVIISISVIPEHPDMVYDWPRMLTDAFI